LWIEDVYFVHFRYKLYAQVPSSSGLLWDVYTRPFSFYLWFYVAVLFFVLVLSFATAAYILKYLQWRFSVTDAKFIAPQKMSKFSKKIKNQLEILKLKQIKHSDSSSQEVENYHTWYSESLMLTWSAFMQQGMYMCALNSCD